MSLKKILSKFGKAMIPGSIAYQGLVGYSRFDDMIDKFGTGIVGVGADIVFSGFTYVIPILTLCKSSDLPIHFGITCGITGTILRPLLYWAFKESKN